MITRCLGVIFAAAMLAMSGCATTGRDTVTQVATIDALLAGAYDGSMTLRDLLEYGDLGIGTFDRLDGEMVVLDGRVWQVCADGTVHAPSLQTTTPFAAVVRFVPDITVTETQAASYEDLQAQINRLVVNPNLQYAVRVRGQFTAVRTRSVPAQQKPYPPLAEVTHHQPEFTATNIAGTLVGFKLPPYVGGINVPGFHLHFLSDDLTFGGHLLACELTDGVIEIDQCHRLLMILPAGDDAFGRVDLSVNRSDTLRKVEH